MIDVWTSAPNPVPLNGSEPFVGIDAKVSDFWSFAMSDLRMNNIRGYVAEFLVSRAVGAQGLRVEWDAFDVRSPDGIKIEVKSSAYLQVWDQRRLSTIQFSGLRGRTWSPQDGESPEPTYNADVYVFCVQTAVTHDSYEPLDVDQWNFYVVSRDAIIALGQSSVGLSTVIRLSGGPSSYADLSVAVTRATTVRAKD